LEEVRKEAQLKEAREREAKERAAQKEARRRDLEREVYDGVLEEVWEKILGKMDSKLKELMREVGELRARMPGSVKEAPKPKARVPKSVKEAPEPKVLVPKSVKVVLKPKARVPESVEVVPEPKARVPKSVKVVLKPKARVPESAEVVPEPKALVPESVEVVPEPKALVPKSVKEALKPKARVPESVEVVPEPKALVPKSVKEAPEPKALVPKSVKEVPEPKALVPKSVKEVPEPKARVPESVKEAPEPKALVPKSVEEVPEPKALDSVEGVSELKALDSVEEVSEPEALDSVEEVPELKALDSVEEVSEPEALDSVEEVSELKALDSVEEVPEPKALDSVEEVSELKALDSVEEVPEPKAEKPEDEDEYEDEYVAPKLEYGYCEEEDEHSEAKLSERRAKICSKICYGSGCINGVLEVVTTFMRSLRSDLEETVLDFGPFRDEACVLSKERFVGKKTLILPGIVFAEIACQAFRGRSIEVCLDERLFQSYVCFSNLLSIDGSVLCDTEVEAGSSYQRDVIQDWVVKNKRVIESERFPACIMGNDHGEESLCSPYNVRWHLARALIAASEESDISSCNCSLNLEEFERVNKGIDYEDNDAVGCRKIPIGSELEKMHLRRIDGEVWRTNLTKRRFFGRMRLDPYFYGWKDGPGYTQKTVQALIILLDF
jgi:hypothetical protein